jgi:hypothetical protein
MRQPVYRGKSDGDRRDVIPLYSRYERDAVLALFKGQPQSVCDGQWVEFPQAVVGLMKIGREPATHFCSATRFHWFADKPYGPWSRDGHTWSIPQQIQAAHDDKTPIHLFVQVADNSFVYVGRLCPPGMIGDAGENLYGQAIFDLVHPLPSAIWQACGGLPIPAIGPEGLDPIAVAINAAQTLGERFAAYRALVEYWRGPLSEADGLEPSAIRNEKLSIPRALRCSMQRRGPAAN